MKDRLTPRERFNLLVIDERPDRCPVIPLLTSYAASIVRAKLRDYYTKGEIMAKAQIAAYEEFRHDAISIFSDVGIIAESCGSEFFYPEEDLPVLSQPVLNRKKISEIKIPNPKCDGRLPVYLTAIEIGYQSLGDRVPILAYIPAPFTTAMHLIAPEIFLRSTIQDPSLVKELLELSSYAAVEFAAAIIDVGGLPLIVDPSASGSLISPRIFKEYALPYERKLIDFLHRYDFDCILHICGDTTPILDLLPETNADLISLDKVPINLARERLGKRMRIIGNFPPTDLLLFHPDEIRVKVQEMVRIGKRVEKGYVAATGCEVPIKTPKENLMAFVESAKEAGWY
jgi:uroporphyrinogen decarboxylase|uniref:Uroporphyrinogen decarboxylase (URO-D) domain-containing protein n=1 Tax=candidate division WOR-3 bacterium TaxID=2052148 RepID=A0A7C3Z0B9_UNCW3